MYISPKSRPLHHHGRALPPGFPAFVDALLAADWQIQKYGPIARSEWNNLCGGQKAIAVRRISCRLWRGISQILESSVCCQGAWVALRIVRDHTVIYVRAYSFCSNDCQQSI
ncbi:hypothetical protein IG631_06848 [Alternaria alternata]|nr:hypothetical protein IG631_06848 [Alternaria alternata]